MVDSGVDWGQSLNQTRGKPLQLVDSGVDWGQSLNRSCALPLWKVGFCRWGCANSPVFDVASFRPADILRSPRSVQFHAMPKGSRPDLPCKVARYMHFANNPSNRALEKLKE